MIPKDDNQSLGVNDKRFTLTLSVADGIGGIVKVVIE